jgi:ADP-heptose:LPS heptosyltransferase
LKASSAPILIIHQGALGDLMMSLPALYSLRIFHAGPWTMAGNQEILSLLDNRFYAQTTISIHQKDWAWFFQEGSRLPEKFGQFLSSFPKAYVFAAHHPEIWIRGLNRAGVQEISWIPSFPDVQQGFNLQSRQRKILDSENIPWRVPGKTIFPIAEDLQKARAYLRKHLGLEEGQPLWAIHPGSGSPHKNWPLARFLETAGKLRDHQRIQPIFLSGPVEQETHSISISAIQTQGFPIVKAQSLPVLAGILSYCNGYLGNDSGISHLAAAVDIPTVVIFGPTDPSFWSPQGTGVKTLTPHCSCAPCDRETRQNCPTKECLTSLNVQQVLEVIGTKIKNSSLDQ